MQLQHPSYTPYDTEDDLLQKVHNPLEVMQPGERIVCELRRHPIGLIGMYLGSALLIIMTLSAAVIAPYFLQDLTGEVKLAIVGGGVLLAFIVLLYAYAATVIYNGNRWIVTSDSITQVTQLGLFTKQASQLSLANLEDVTVEQNGILPSMFGYGLLRAETAGERSKFAFPFCPNPTGNAKKIIGAHEAYIADRPKEMYATNRPVGTGPSLNQPTFGDQNQNPPSPMPPYKVDQP